MIEQVLSGFTAGLIATGAMTLTELPSWKRWGLHGVFEWHENQAITERIIGSSKTNFFGIFFLHFLNGGLAGIAFCLLLSLLPTFTPSIFLLSTTYGIILWILTLAPIHKPLTGLHPWNHPLGKMPAIASLSGHVVFGVTVGAALVIING
jgi:hypothetical protein